MQGLVLAVAHVSLAKNLHPDNGVAVPVRRLLDFQGVVAGWPSDVPVAYWDVGDVIFQSRLQLLWDLVRTHHGSLLAVSETGHPKNPAVAKWSEKASE